MEGVPVADISLLNYRTYKDYINSFITARDFRYVRDIKALTQIVKIGYRSNQEVYTQQQFEKHKEIAEEAVNPRVTSRILFSEYLDSDDPVLTHLAKREKLNVQKIISTIFFLMRRTSSGFEVSGYIDFEESCRRSNLFLEGSTDWKAVFEGRKKICPKPHHLSYFDWHKNVVRYNDSDNYIVLQDIEHGLMFMHRGDHKIVCVGTEPGEYIKNAERTMVYSDIYGYVIFYDHHVRKKN